MDRRLWYEGVNTQTSQPFCYPKWSFYITNYYPRLLRSSNNSFENVLIKNVEFTWKKIKEDVTVGLFFWVQLGKTFIIMATWLLLPHTHFYSLRDLRAHYNFLLYFDSLKEEDGTVKFAYCLVPFIKSVQRAGKRLVSCIHNVSGEGLFRFLPSSACAALESSIISIIKHRNCFFFLPNFQLRITILVEIVVWNSTQDVIKGVDLWKVNKSFGPCANVQRLHSSFIVILHSTKLAVEMVPSWPPCFDR